MADYSVFDSFLDSVFVVDTNLKVLYCNDPAANLCQTSVRRILGKSVLSDLIKFSDITLPFPEIISGQNTPGSYIETEFSLLKAEKVGKVQLVVHPIGEGCYTVIMHDVGLEEALHSKYRAELAQKEGYINELEEARRKLEDYSRNLEAIVSERTLELRKLNETLSAVLNSLGQGFLTFNKAGETGKVYTKACAEIMGTAPDGKNIKQLLRIDEAKISEFDMWLKALFSEALPFDNLKVLGPSTLPLTADKHITLDYYPLRQNDQLTEVVTVATDKTAEWRAQLELERERQYASMVVRYVKNKDQFLQFLISLKKNLGAVEAIARSVMSQDQIDEAFRVLHTIEGEAGTFSVMSIRNLAKEAQKILEPLRKNQASIGEVQKQFLDSVLELQSHLIQFLKENSHLIKLPKEGNSRTVEIEADDLRNFANQMSRDGVAKNLISDFFDTFLIEPVEKRFSAFEGLVQDVAIRLGKKIKPLVIVGGETKIHPEPYANFFASLVHVFRNAVDHGIEPPDERGWIEKDEAGQIQISFEQKGQYYLLRIEDDGQGIDRSRLRKKLSERFPNQDFANLGDDELIQCIFLPGFSSRETIGEFSGRGVGMDAVKAEVSRIGGTVKVFSEEGKGSRFEFELPVLGFEMLPFLRSA